MGITSPALTKAQADANYASTVAAQPPTLTNPPTVLPRVTIETVGAAPILDTVTYVDATVTINGAQPYSGTTQIRGRGNTTWGASKKPYRLKLTTTSSLLGMPTERDWVLLAPGVFDPTYLRTAVTTEIGQRLPSLAWTPRFRYVELVLNGVFLGLYQLGEHVEISRPNKINVTVATGTTGLALTGAYTLEIDQRLEQNAEPGFRTTLKSVPIVLDDPDGTTAAHLTYIQNWINNFESVLYGSSWLDPTTGYKRLVDVPSFVGWYIVNEFAKNADSNFFSSCKLYKTRDTDTVPGKLYMGPLWDFDRAYGSTDAAPEQGTITGYWTRVAGGGHPGALWIDRMLGDPAFFAELVAQWTTLADSLRRGDSLGAVIDRLTDRLAPAINRDKRKWGLSMDVIANSDAFKTWVAARTAWLSTQWIIDTVAPSVPAGLTVTTGTGQLGLTWNASTDNIMVAKYRVRRGGTVVGEPTTTSFTDTGLTNGTQYSYTVSAVDGQGNESAQSSAATGTPSATDTTAPSVPTGLNASAGNAQAVLSWTASTDNVGVTGYKVRRGGTLVSSPTTTSFTDTGLTNGTTYSYTVSAVDAAGNESAQTAAATVTPSSVVAETFTGADGASWPSPWTPSNTGTVKLLSNAGQITPATGAYNGAFAYRTAPGDAEVLLRWQWQTAPSERYFDVSVRAAGTGTPKWRLRIVPEGLRLGVNTGVSSTMDVALGTGTWRWLKVRFQGTTVQARVWDQGASEPSTWTVQFTDASGPTSGNLVLEGINGGASTSAVLLIDDLSIATL